MTWGEKQETMGPKQPREKNPEAGLAKVRSERCCRVCGLDYGLQRHHLIPRSLMGADRDENIIPLCLLCHEAFEHGTNRREVAARIRAVLTVEEIGYVIGQKSRVFLDSYYPQEARQ